MSLPVWDFRLVDSACAMVVTGSIAMVISAATIFFTISSPGRLFSVIFVCIRASLTAHEKAGLARLGACSVAT